MPDSAPSPSAVASLALGVLAIACAIIAVVLTSTADGLAFLGVAIQLAIPTALIGVVGLVVCILAKRARAQPRWMTTTGMILNIVALAFPLLAVLAMVSIWMTFEAMSGY